MTHPQCLMHEPDAGKSRASRESPEDSSDAPALRGLVRRAQLSCRGLLHSLASLQPLGVREKQHERRGGEGEKCLRPAQHKPSHMLCTFCLQMQAAASPRHPPQSLKFSTLRDSNMCLQSLNHLQAERTIPAGSTAWIPPKRTIPAGSTVWIPSCHSYLL